MQIDTDGEMSVEMVRMLVWDHQGDDLTIGDIPGYFQPPHPAPPAGEEQVILEAPAGEEQADLERRARDVYQRLGAAMEEELAEDMRFFLEHPSRSHRVRAAFPAAGLYAKSRKGNG